MKKRKREMPNRNDEHSETVASELGAIPKDLQGVLGEPSGRQRRLIANLDRLRRSLLGPEDLLDRTSYSRPFPPHNHHSKGTDAGWQPSRTLEIPEE